MLLECQNALLHQIKKWCELQVVYMPGVLNVNTSDLESSRREKVETIKLWLPSQLESSNEHASICIPGVVSSEKEL